MKRKLITTVMTMVAIVAAAQMSAQTLGVDRIFAGDIPKSKNATEILVTGKPALKLHMDLYHSLIVDGDEVAAREIENAVLGDAAKAESKEVEYRQGRLYFGIFTFKPASAEPKAPFRYVVFLNQGLSQKNPKSRLSLIYIESRCDQQYVKDIITRHK